MSATRDMPIADRARHNPQTEPSPPDRAGGIGKAYEAGWPHGYCTEDGRSVRLLTTTAAGRRPLVGLINNDRSDEEIACQWRPDGRYSDDDTPHPLDLRCVVPIGLEPTDSDMMDWVSSNKTALSYEGGSGEWTIFFRQKNGRPGTRYATTLRAVIREAMLADTNSFP